MIIQKEKGIYIECSTYLLIKMNNNILFIFNTFPGIGGLESASNNIIDYIGKHFSIYTLAINSQLNVSTSPYIIEMHQFQSIDNQEDCITYLNDIIKKKNINYIINQGIYPELTNIIFSSSIETVKIFSFLHGMPKYEEKQYWQLPNISNTSRSKLLKRKFLSCLGLNRKYKKYINSFAKSYRKACIKGDKMILLCDEYIEPFIKKYKLEEYHKKIISIENPLSIFFSRQDDINWDIKKNRVIFVGRLSKEKRIDIILKVWEKIESQTNWELIIVGNGELMSELRDITHKNNIQNVFFTGWTALPQNYYKEAKIILLTSDFEGFPMCLIEAQRFGVVPLTFNISAGVRSIISNGGGVIVHNREPKDMSLKLLELIKDDYQLKLFSKQVRIKSDRYTLDEIGSKWIKLLNEYSNEKKVN